MCIFSAASELFDFLHLLFGFNIFGTHVISIEVLIYCKTFSAITSHRGLVIFVSTGMFDCVLQN